MSHKNEPGGAATRGYVQSDLSTTNDFVFDRDRPCMRGIWIKLSRWVHGYDHTTINTPLLVPISEAKNRWAQLVLR